MLTLAHLLQSQVKENPHSIALEFGEKKITFLELSKKATCYASNLQNLGVDPGSVVGIFAVNSLETIVLFIACSMIGVVACPLNTRCPLQEIKNQLCYIHAKALLVPDEMLEILQECHPTIIPFSSLMAPTHSLKESFFDIATYLFTSGSSSTPKVVVHTHANHIISAESVSLALKLSSQDRYLLCLPFFHVGGLGIIYRCLATGGTLVLYDKKVPLPNHLQRNIQFVSLVPTQLQTLLTESLHLASLKGILLGGAATPQELIQKSLKASLPIYISYGSTEASSTLTMNNLSTQGCITTSSGWLLAKRELRISSSSEIEIKGPTLFKGYLQPDGSIYKSSTEDGYFPTGDIGSYSEESGLLIKGRKDRMFISGGENIHPEEIERAILQFPGISRAQIQAKFDPIFGMRPVALIESSQKIDISELKGFLEKLLPKYKIPSEFNFELASLSKSWKERGF